MATLQEVKAAVEVRAATVRLSHRKALGFLQRHYSQARTYNVTVERHHVCVALAGAAETRRAPPTLTWLTPRGLSGSGADLLLGHTPIARNNWRYDTKTRTLSFHQGTGDDHVSGTLHMLGLGTRMTGHIQTGERVYGVSLDLAPVYYDCRTAQGAVDAAGQKSNVQLRWDVNSAEWKNAAWSSQPDFRFTYQIVKEGTYGGQTVFFVKVSFQDRTDPDNPITWTPPGFDLGEYTAFATPEMYFDFFVNEITPPTTSPLFPFVFNVQMSPDTSTFVGGMLTQRDDISGTTYGLQGTYGGIANGFYVVERDGVPAGLVSAVNGQFAVDGTPLPGVLSHTGVISWADLSEPHQQATGLPATGRLAVSPSGHRAWDPGNAGVSLRRVSNRRAMSLAKELPAARKLRATAQDLGGEDLSIQELMTFSQFGQPDGKTWQDLVQNATTEDVFNILMYYMDDTLRESFVSINKPVLDPTIKGIAQTPGSDGQDPSKWYATLGVAYVTSNQGKFSSDEYAAYLNWKRASSWLNQQIQTASVMQVQGPVLYGNRYAAQNPVDKYLVDQQSNTARYNAALTQEIDDWIAETVQMANGDPDTQAKIQSDMETLKSVTLNDKTYWAYVMCRTFISPNFLTFLEAIGISPDQGSDASAFALRIQETAALLSVLDPSGTFAKKFVEVIEAFDLACIVPKLINYSGNVDEYVVAVQAILQKFVEQYEDNPAPGMKDAAAAIQKAIENDQIKELLDAFANAMSGVVGSSGFDAAVAAFDSQAAKIVGSGAELVASGVMMASIGFTIACLVTGQVKWSDLDAEEQAAFIAATTAFLAMAITKIVVRGVSVSALLNPDDGFFTAFKLFFSPLLKQNAQRAMADGVKGWLIGGNDLEGEIDGLQMQRLFAESVEEEAELDNAISSRIAVGKYLGANLDEFVATRLGAVLALAGMAFAIYGLATSTNPFETAANACFLAASTLDFFIAVGSWAIASGVTEIGGVAIAALLPFLSVFALLAFIAGAVLIIVLLFVCKPKDPLEVFAEGDAKDAGFYMPNKFAIEYFEVYQPEGQAQRLGVALMLGGSDQTCLAVGDDGTLSLAPLDNSARTVFYLKVNYNGYASIAAPLRTVSGQIDTKVLAIDKDTGALVALTPDVNTPTDPYAQWICVAQGAPTKDGDQYEAGTFTLQNVGQSRAGPAASYLGAAQGAPVAAPAASDWLLEMEPVKIGGVAMADITMMSNWKDQAFSPLLTNVSSGPFTWSVRPALPSFMQFDETTGKVSQVPQTAPTVMPATNYTLAVSNPLGTAQTTFALSVQQV